MWRWLNLLAWTPDASFICFSALCSHVWWDVAVCPGARFMENTIAWCPVITANCSVFSSSIFHYACIMWRLLAAVRLVCPCDTLSWTNSLMTPQRSLLSIQQNWIIIQSFLTTTLIQAYSLHLSIGLKWAQLPTCLVPWRHEGCNLCLNTQHQHAIEIERPCAVTADESCQSSVGVWCRVMSSDVTSSTCHVYSWKRTFAKY